MRTLLFSLLLAALPNFIFAQIDDLLKNKDISYLATFETEHDFRLSVKQEKAKLQLLKYSHPSRECYHFSTDNWLAEWLLEGMKNGQFSAYDDPEMSVFVGQPVLQSRIQNVEIVTTFNPETYEEKTQTITNSISASEIIGFKTYQAIYYDKKSGGFHTRLLSIAPLVKELDANGNPLRTAPLAWIKMDEKVPSRWAIDSPDVVWAMLLIDNGNVLEINKLKVKKDDVKKPFAEFLFQEVITMKHDVEDMSGYGCGEKLTKRDLEHMTNSIDTVIVFDPETAKETVYIVKNEIKPSEDIKELSLVQEWYYDDRQKRVANRLLAIVPRVGVSDEKGQFLYNKGMFFFHVESKL